MAPPLCTPLSAGIQVRHRSADRASMTYRIGPAEEVLTGHYPGFPIFPGVCIVESVHQSALAAPPIDRPMRLAAIFSTRFLSATFPGDELVIELQWNCTGSEWDCVANVSTHRGRTAAVRLLFEPEDSR